MIEEVVSKGKVEAGKEEEEDRRLQLKEVVSLQITESCFIYRNTFSGRSDS